MRAAGSHIRNFSVFNPDHAAACHTQGAHIQRGKIGFMTAYFAVPHHDAAVLDYRDIRRGSSGFQKNAVRKPLVHQYACNAGGQPRQHGQNRATPHFVHVHYAAVAAHNHQGGGNAGAFYTGLGHVGGFHHFGNQAAVDDGSAGTHPEPVEFGNLMASRCVKAFFTRQFHHELFVVRIIHAVRFRCHDDFGAGFFQLFNR